MSTVVRTNFAVKPLVAAVAVAFSAVSAYAAPTPNQLPGFGLIKGVNTGTTISSPGVTYFVSGGGTKGDQVYDGLNPGTLQLNNAGATARAVISWGPFAGSLEVCNPAGFNIGSAGKLTFTSSAAVTSAAVLNLDTSGNPSQIFGVLASTTAGGGSAPAIFVANTNGIIVGAGARIAAPNGVGLIGADLNNATAINDFIGNNSTGVSYVDVVTGNKGVVQINGAINGDLTLNLPAAYILLASVGGDIVNTGNLFANDVVAFAGITAATEMATVNLVANTPVNRLWDVNAGALPGVFNGDLGTAPGNVQIASASSSFVNTGSISSQFGSIFVDAANNITSGTLGDPNLLVGLYSDGDVELATFGTGTIGLYNVLSGYSTGKTLVSLSINQEDGAQGDVIINLLTPASQPSSVSTTDSVMIAGTNVTINSTINHKLASAGGTQLFSDETVIAGTKSVTINKDVGSGGELSINSESGSIKVLGNLISNTSLTGGDSDIDIESNATTASDITVTGNVTIAGSVYGSVIQVQNYGNALSTINISGTLTNAAEDVFVFGNGNLTFSGTINAGENVHLSALGTKVSLQGPINAGTAGYGVFTFAAPNANTTVYPAAVITANAVALGLLDNSFDGPPASWVGTLNFTGVNASGLPYNTASEKPAAQIVTNNLDAMLLGNMNAPIAGNTNWLKNAMVIAALDPTMPINASVSVVGAAVQAVNLAFTGSAVVDSGMTITPFDTLGVTSGFFPVGGLIANGGSQLIYNASANLTVVADSTAQDAFGDMPGFGTRFGPFWEQPGGAVFKAGGTVTQMAPIYNAWTTVAQPFQGVFFEGSIINNFSYIATNGNSWANWNVPPNGILPPSTSAPTVYQIAQGSLLGGLLPTFGFQNNLTAPHQNTYSLEVVGGPVFTCPVFTCGWH